MCTRSTRLVTSVTATTLSGSIRKPSPAQRGCAGYPRFADGLRDLVGACVHVGPEPERLDAEFVDGLADAAVVVLGVVVGVCVLCDVVGDVDGGTADVIDAVFILAQSVTTSALRSVETMW